LMAFPDQLPGKGKANPQDDERLCAIYESPGGASATLGGPKMVVYRLIWDGICPEI
jgi:hypothetical protein